MRRVCCVAAALLLAVAAADGCARPAPGPGWAAARVTLDRVRRCKGYWFFCISRLTRREYAPFEKAASRREQKRLFLARVNAPEPAATRSVVLGIAGGGDASAITGQRRGFATAFTKRRASAPYTLGAASLVNDVLRTGMFARKDTFVALVFDARFGYDAPPEKKERMETGYFDYVVSRLGPAVDTIYLAGHSRGGCLAMRLSARLARKFPTARVIVHNFDGVCAPARAGERVGEFGVVRSAVENPRRKGYKVVVTDVAKQFPARNCVAVRSFLSGECLTTQVPTVAEPVHAFGNVGFGDAQDELVTPAGFSWYTQSFHTEGHIAIAGRHHAKAVAHLRQAFDELPCTCRA